MADASNIVGGVNPSYTIQDFFAWYPQFDGDIVPPPVAQGYLTYAHACLKYNRYKAHWIICMGLFIAHFLTLYLQTLGDGLDADASEVIATAEAHGVIVSESAGGVSDSQNVNVITDDLNGWAQWKLTQYGVQFASIARLIGKGGSYVW